MVNYKKYLLWVLVALLAGWSQAISLADPWSGAAHGWLQLLALTAVVYLLQFTRTKAAFLLGWLFASTWLAVTVWWLFISMHYYGELMAPLALLAVLFLAAALALYYALALALYRYFKQDAYLLSSLLFAALWTLAELARGYFFTGFPWGAIGYAQVDNWLFTAFAPWVGVYGMGWLAALVAALLAQIGYHLLLVKQQYRRLITPLIALLVWLLLALAARSYNAQQTAAEVEPAPFEVTLLQGNIPLETKFNIEGIMYSIDWYQQQVLAASSDLVVSPETALPLPQTMLPKLVSRGFEQHLQQQPQQALLLGIIFENQQHDYSNTLLGVTTEQADFNRAFRYDKQHLVPFGEFVPEWLRWFTNLLNIPYDNLLSDPDFGRRTFSWKELRLALTICFEDLFGEEIAQYFAAEQLAPNVLINVSNISWFGNSSILAQHLNISRLRSLEFHRPLLRSANSGPTAVINAQGEVVAALDNYTQAVLTAQVQPSSLITPYASWVSRFDLYPLWLLQLLLAAVLAAYFYRSKRQR